MVFKDEHNNAATEGLKHFVTLSSLSYEMKSRNCSIGMPIHHVVDNNPVANRTMNSVISEQVIAIVSGVTYQIQQLQLAIHDGFR